MLVTLSLGLLKRNQISKIDDDAFSNLTSLRELELNDNRLSTLPKAIGQLTSLQELSLSGNRLKNIPGGILQRTPGLTLLELNGNPLNEVDLYAFSFLPNLKKLILSDARNLKEFPNLNGTSALEFLRLDRASINYVPPSLCRFCPRLKSLDLKVNRLTTIPDLTFCRELRVLLLFHHCHRDLAHNKITELEGRPFKNLSLLHDLLLSHNSISNIPREAFIGLKRLQFL
uniref:Uncharacterized protein n=1 Tax=Timema douglasi TaxID=61478 RepID=A0A7R8Z519_TIMDO|nr:unnamed protein product [Timema douglasi]